jgi:hypothetical protein
MTSLLQSPASPALELAYSLPNGERITRKLGEGESVVIGSDTSADLRLEAADIARMHCMVRVHDGQAIVRDCYSSAGTFVNDERIRETVLHYDSQVRVGSNVINVRVGRPRSAALSSPVIHATERLAPAERETLHEQPERPCSIPSFLDGNELQAELDQAHAEIAVLRERLRIMEKTVAESQSDPLHDEMVELLRAEVFELQSALAEREPVAAPRIEHAGNETGDDDAPLDQGEVDRLVARLEQLLGELQERDEQVALLNDLLQAAEEANRADQEERSQLDGWVADIERRFSQREQEWAAEREKLLKKAAGVQPEKIPVEALPAADEGSVRAESLQRVANGLREQIAQLQSELEASRQRNQQLEQEVENIRGSFSREEAVKLCQERAEIARMRRELELRRQEVDSRRSETRSLREQLLQDEPEPRKGSLGSRVARLWNLIDGR